MKKVFLTMAIGVVGWSMAQASELKVNITPDMPSVTIVENGTTYVIKRNQDVDNTIVDDYALTSRQCPPFCVQPMQLLPGVHTIGELEMLDFLKARSNGDKNILIVDSRTPDWVQKGSIPGAINIPWTQLYPEASSYEPFEVEDLLTTRFGAEVNDGIWDFSQAKTLVMFCNGPWCGQSPVNIKALVNMGYPADKLYWYRGGMQAWHALGLTTTTPR